MIHTKKGFTLIEIIIVINIIGILVVSLYPSLTQYLERARQTDAKIAMQKFVGVFNNYILDHGAIVGQPPQLNNAREAYMIPVDPNDPGGSGWVVHTSFRDYFHATPERKKILEDAAKKTMWTDGRGVYFAITSYNRESYYYWWPGRDPADTTKRTWLWFYLPANNSSYHGLAANGGTPYAAYTWNGVNYPAGFYKDWHGSGVINNDEMDKYCFGGGQTSNVSDDTNDGTIVECDYWF